MNQILTYRAKWVWSGDDLPIENGSVTVDHSQQIIVNVSSESPPDAIDLGNYCLLPGFVNSHCHLEFSDLRGPVPASGSFAEWIVKVVQYRATAALMANSQSIFGNSVGTDKPLEPRARGLLEAYSSGTRFVNDVVTVHAKPNDLRLDANVGAFVCGFAEWMSTTHDRAKQTRRASRNVLDVNQGTITNGGISPHAPYTTTGRLVDQAGRFCKRWNLPVMMHLAESRDEVRWLSNGDGPLQEMLDLLVGPFQLPIQDRLSMEGYIACLLQAKFAWVIHGNYLDEASQSLLEKNRNRSTVVYCPRTHSHFGHDRYPLYEYRRRGIRVCLGTDSRASNPDLSILEEARWVRRLFNDLSAVDILKMITTDPSQCLSKPQNIGSLTKNASSNFIAIPVEATRKEDVIEFILQSDSQPQAIDSLRQC